MGQVVRCEFYDTLYDFSCINKALFCSCSLHRLVFIDWIIVHKTVYQAPLFLLHLLFNINIWALQFLTVRFHQFDKSICLRIWKCLKTIEWVANSCAMSNLSQQSLSVRTLDVVQALSQWESWENDYSYFIYLFIYFIIIIIIIILFYCCLHFYRKKYNFIGTTPSRHMTSIQRRLNVDATSWRCIDVESTLHRRHVPARQLILEILMLTFKYLVCFCFSRTALWEKVTSGRKRLAKAQIRLLRISMYLPYF